MNSIAEFLKRKLLLLHEHPPISRANKDGPAKVRQAMENHNRHITNNLGFEGIDLSPEELAEMKIAVPAALKDKPVTYTATANYYWGDGELAKQVDFAVEVIP